MLLLQLLSSTIISCNVIVLINKALYCVRQANLEAACWGLRPTMGHYGCPMMMMGDDCIIAL